MTTITGFAASRLLNMNQTTVSCRIETLEHALGLGLFTRTTRGLARKT
jgi:DNA-binding transcriptional LysR family regulator